MVAFGIAICDSRLFLVGGVFCGDGGVHDVRFANFGPLEGSVAMETGRTCYPALLHGMVSAG